MEKILLNDLKRHHHLLSGELRMAMERVLKSGWFILGPELEAFEEEFAAWCGALSCCGVANGTDALELAMRASGIVSGDEVATVANAGGYSTTAILAIGAVPLYVDVTERGMTMSAAALATALTPKTRAVVVTHLYGGLADIEEIMAVAGNAGIPVIEDCAQAHGARRGPRKAGTFGQFGCFSFYPTKNLGALGDGGAIITSDPTLASRVRQLRQYGWGKKYLSELGGGRNSRLDEMQAAVLRVKLPYLERWNDRRRELARHYSAALAETKLVTPSLGGEDYVAHLYVIRAAQRDALQSALKDVGIMAEPHYPVPDHRQPSLRGREFIAGDLSLTEKYCAEVLSLPCFPEMRDEEVNRVIDALTRV